MDENGELPEGSKERNEEEGQSRAEQEKQEAELDKLLEKYQPVHGRVVGFYDEDYGCFVFKKPARVPLKRFISEVNDDDADQQVAAENFALACVLHPPRQEFSGILDEMPGFAPQAANEIQKIAGFSGKARSKKRTKR